MIKTAIQLKAKIRNLSGGDNDKAKVLIRNFIMERFLERVSLSPYRNNFILKGGMLVASVVGLETRATMDIDTTVKSLTLSTENARSVIEKIILIDVDDGVTFEIKKVSDIMEGHDYPGIRFMLEAKLDMIRQMIKIDISTGDIITPEAVEYSYKLMFENRSISLWTYNLETMLGEKLETIMARENANTRMRDFYDIFILTEEKNVDYKILYSAFMATSEKRETTTMISRFDSILESVLQDSAMRKMWDMYRDENYFVGDLSWECVNERVRMIKNRMFEEK
jgi:predicted nucleotidyltransferase component of viral defense system